MAGRRACASALAIASICSLPACTTQLAWDWAGQEVRVAPWCMNDARDEIHLRIKNVTGFEDGWYVLFKDSKKAETMVAHRSSRDDSPTNRFVLVGTNMVYRGPDSPEFWTETLSGNGAGSGDSLVRLELDDPGHPSAGSPRDVRGGAAIVRSAGRHYRVLTFEWNEDAREWSKTLECDIGDGTQSSLRPIGAVLMTPFALAFDVITFPVQGFGCCLFSVMRD